MWASTFTVPFYEVLVYDLSCGVNCRDIYNIQNQIGVMPPFAKINIVLSGHIVLNEMLTVERYCGCTVGYSKR